MVVKKMWKVRKSKVHGKGIVATEDIKKNTKIIELTNYQWPNLYQKLSKCLNLNYKKILCDKIDNKSNKFTYFNCL